MGFHLKAFVEEKEDEEEKEEESELDSITSQLNENKKNLSKLTETMNKYKAKPAQIEEDKAEDEKKEEEKKLELKKDEGETASTTFMSKIDGIEFVLINDYGSVFCPILDIRMPTLLCEFTQTPKSMKATVEVVMESNYYNPEATYWEPILETAHLQFLYLTEDKQPNKFAISSQKPINLNISVTFLGILTQTFYLWKKPKIESLNEKAYVRKIMQEVDSEKAESEEVATPFSIKNETGLKILISESVKMRGEVGEERKKEKEVVSLEHEEILDISTSYKEIIESKESMLQKYHYDITFQPSLGYKPIQNISVSNVQTTIHFLKNISIYHPYDYVLCSVNLETMRKVLTIRSAFNITNTTNIPLSFIFKDDESKIINTFSIQKGENFTIPVPLIYKKVSIKLKDSEAESTSFLIFKLMQYLKDMKTVRIKYFYSFLV
jgi:hypothetical protein